ncbi:MAG TPA: metallophosphoesterase [Thermoanaerobaculia bacterium]|nr:metallophosphoesterase [Thermoanaerobaculia bacterium]
MRRSRWAAGIVGGAIGAVALAGGWWGEAAPGQMPAAKVLPGTPALGEAKDPGHFTFVVAGDNRPAKKKDPPSSTVVVKIFRAIRKLQPSFLVMLGDTIFGKEPDNKQRVDDEYSGFLALAAGAGAPVFNAPGNHEMDDQNDVPNATMQQWYAATIGPPYSAFSFGNSRFILLDTEESPPAGTQRAPGAPAEGGKTLDPGYVSAAQLALLKGDLDANRDKAHVFIFMHHPIKPKDPKAGLDPHSAKQLTDLFSGYPNVSYVLAAHEHLYFNPQDPANVATVPSRTDPAGPPTYLVSGGAGAPLNKHTPPAQGGFHHYLVFQVAGNQVGVTLVNLDAATAASSGP